jgi:acyl carrier protein|tara:strand:- start:62 stop:334 length:273 start_codon:yes stop_codon:yes gene_type:complete
MKGDNINKNNSSIETQIIDYLKNFNPLKMNQFENQNEIVISNILDSMEMIKLLVFLEKTFDINIDEGDVLLENFQYVRTVVEYVKKKQNK